MNVDANSVRCYCPDISQYKSINHVESHEKNYFLENTFIKYYTFCSESIYHLIRVCENQDLYSAVSCKLEKKKRSLVIPIVASVIGGTLMLLLSAAAIWFGLARRKRSLKRKIYILQTMKLFSSKSFFTISFTRNTQG